MTVLIEWVIVFNSLTPSDVYMRKYALITYAITVQIMACSMTGAKPLSEPVLQYCWLGPWKQTSTKF